MVDKKMTQARIAVFTVITGNYDYVIPPLYCQQSDNVDFIVFSDTPIQAPSFYEIRSLPQGVGDVIRAARYPRMNSHLVLDEYDITVYVDGNTMIVHPDIRSYVENILSDVPQAQFIHNERNCIFSEAEKCKYQKIDSPEIIDRHMDVYRAEGMPENFGLGNTNIIFRRQSDPLVQRANELWWKEYHERGSRRDQLSFDYVRWKVGLPVKHIKQLWSDNEFGIRFNHPRHKYKKAGQANSIKSILRVTRKSLPATAKSILRKVKRTGNKKVSPVFRPTRLVQRLTTTEKETYLTYQLRFPTYVGKNPRIVVIGCDKGNLLYRLLRHYPYARLLAIDPAAESLENVKRIARQVPTAEVDIVSSLIGTKQKETKVYNYKDGTVGKLYRHKLYTVEKVRESRLADHLMDEKIDLLKINVGGMEGEIMNNIRPLLRRVQNVHIEYHELPGKAQELSDILKLLTEEGFKYFIATPENPNHRPLELHRTERGMSYQCWIAARRRAT